MMWISAIDARLMDSDRFETTPGRADLGDKIKPKAEPYGISNEFFRLTDWDIDFLQPAAGKMQFGATRKTLTEQIYERR